MEFRLLGPVEVRDKGSVVPIAAGKERALLALLLLHSNRTVTRERIIDDLWGEAAPSSARKMVQVYVSHLRKALPEQRLQTSAPGYVFKVEPDEVDAERFERLAESGRRALASGDARRGRGSPPRGPCALAGAGARRVHRAVRTTRRCAARGTQDGDRGSSYRGGAGTR